MSAIIFMNMYIKLNSKGHKNLLLLEEKRKKFSEVQKGHYNPGENRIVL